MTNLQDLINLAKADGGKFFVMDEKGEVKLVLMGIEDYQNLLLGKLQRTVKRQAEDIEKINREILKAQLQDSETVVPEPEVPKPLAPRVIYSSTSSTAAAPASPAIPRVDLREEVIDPSFDFEGPKMDLEDF